MQIYLVGGAVRDQLLSLPIQERDWVVVGATPEEMFAQGFVKVGKDFPVFLHPTTHEEYALARTERKTGKGYHGFECYAAPDVTLEQDLQRRDLTINAIAQDTHGKIIDPYHGQQDIQRRILRHVSYAFHEDPVRILRTARFASRFADLGFYIAQETIELMQHMVDMGEVDALLSERVWQEWQRSLITTQPAIFLAELHRCHALQKLFPELVSFLNDALILLRDTAKRSADPIIRFSATTLSAENLNALAMRYRVPNNYRDLAELIQRYYTTITQAHALSADQLLTLFTQLDVWRRPPRFQKFIQACIAMDPKNKAVIEFLQQAYEITAAITATEFIQQGLQGSNIHIALQQKRLEALAAAERPE